MRFGWVVVLGVLALGGCRTIVDLKPRPPEKAAEGPRREGCDVTEYQQATDIPQGAKNLGTVRVPREKDDEETYAALRKAICEKGGDAFSGLHWVKEPGVWEPTALEATAWSQP